MTRIALISDQHFDSSSRFEECQRLCHWIGSDIAARGVNLVALGGDLFERKPTPAETDAAARWVIQLANIAPVLGVYGNHDVPDSLAVLERLDARHPVRFHDRPALHVGAGIAIAALPWPRRGNLAAMLPDKSREEVEQAAGDALRQILRGLGQQMAQHEDKTRLFLGHVMLRGSETSVGNPLVGCDFELGLDDLATVNADAYLLGHIHKSQNWEINGAPAIYPGSPRRTAFGEIEAKGYVVIDCDGHGVRWEFVEAPATKMVQVNASWTGDGFTDLRAGMGSLAQAECEGAEVRLRYDVASDQRDAARAAAAEIRAELLGMGVASVKVEEVVRTETRSRTPEIAAALTLADKLQALWKVQKFEPAERREALLTKLSQIEEASRAA